MATNYSPTIVTDGAVFMGDALMPSISEPGTRVYNRAGVNSADVKLLIHGNVGSGQSFSDSSLSNHTVTVAGNVTHSTTQSKFNGGSIYFDGTGDYLSVADSADWTFGTGDFTIDLWIYPTTIGSGGNKNYIGTNPNQYLTFASNNSGGLLFYYGNGTWTSTPAATSNVVVNNAWQHVAVSRSSGTVYLFCNGVLMTSRSQSASIDPPNIEIGAYGGGASDLFVGYMDEVRITKGTALWTQNFTPPARRDTLSISDGMMYNGTCLNFDGTDEYVLTSGYFGALAGDDAVTLCAWINVDTTGDMGIISIGNVYMSIIVNGGYLEGRCYDSGSQLTNTDAHEITPNQWCHVAGVFSGGNVTLYKDGVATAAVACTNEAIGEASTYFQIGKGYTSGYLWMDGEMANPMAFNTALSASQIQEIYQDSKVIIPSNVSQTNLKGWWTFAEGAGTICYDGSGRGIDGEFQNMEAADWSTGQTGCPQLVEGYNRPMLFDGSSDYVDCGASNALVTGTTVSVSAWVLNSGGANKGRIFQAQKAAGSTVYSLMVNDYTGTPTAGSLSMLTWNGSSHDYLSFDVSCDDSQWHHVAMVITASSQKIYFDGALKNTGSAVFSNTVSSDEAGIGSLDVGSDQFFDGLINEVVLYDSELSLAQVQALAATGPNGGPLPPDPMSLSNSSNVVGYWRNDGNVTWTDRSANSNTGTVYGSPDTLLFKQGINGSASTSTGRDGQGFPLKYKDVGAIGFVNDSVDFGNVISFDNTDNFTVEAWFQADVASGMDSYQPIVSKEGSSEFGYGLKIDRAVAGGPWFYGIATGTTNRYQYAAALTNGEWYHGCVLFSSSTNYITVFINGEQSHGPYASQGAFSGTTSANSLKFGQTGSSFIGQIGSSKIYNRLLSQAEIKQNYNAQKSRFT